MLKTNTLLILFITLLFGMLAPMQAQQTKYVISKTAVLRDLPSINGNGVGMPLYGEMLYLLGDRSQEKATVRVNGELVEGVWLKVQTQSDQMAWIHEGQLSDNAPMPVYYSWVDQLRIRSAPNLQSNIVGKLSEMDVVSFTGRRSRDRETIKLRTQNEAHYWLEVQTSNNTSGWVYGGGLKPLKNDNSDFSETNDPSNSHNFNGVVPVNPVGPTDPNLTNNKPKTPWATIIVSQEEAIALNNWWNSLNMSWQDYFSEVVLQRPVENLRLMPDKQQLSYIKSIKKLKLDNNDECGSGPFYIAQLQDLNGIAQLTELEELSCDYMQIRDLRPLMKLKKLKSLSLNHTQLESLEGLDNLSALKWLDISVQGKDLDLKPLSKIRNLEELYLEADKLESFDDLRSSLKLKKLVVRIPDLRSIRGLDALFNLEHLSIKAEQSEIDLRPLARLSKLTYCNLQAYGLNFMQVLASSTKLKYLTVSSQNNSFNANILNTLSLVEELEIQATEINAPERIGQLRNLKALSIGKLDSFDFRQINNCKQLFNLKVVVNRPMNMKALASFPKLARLSIESNSIQTIMNIPVITGLTHISINSSQLSDLQGLGRFPLLYSADFSNCQNLRDLRHVKLLDVLQNLYIPRKIPLNSPAVQSIQRPNLDINYEALGGC
jgi:hypothetical protein